jgi:thioredoxin reductase (NADPH)
MKTPGHGDLLDILVVGAGPAGLGVLHAAQLAGLSAVAVDKGAVCGALCSHPTYMRWFSTADKLELGGFPLVTSEKNPTRQEYLNYLRAFVRYFDLQVASYREVVSILSDDGAFSVAAKDLYEREYVWRARHVVLATGFYDSPRPLGIPGEHLPKVSHRYTEPHWYFDQDVLVIGGGSSAAEVALELCRNGSRVSVAMRGARFETKYWIEPDIENRIKEGSITCYRGVEVVEIRPDDVMLQESGGKQIAVPNDFVLAMTGYEPDTSLLEAVGALVDPACGRPALNEFFETTLPGLYVAGTLCAGDEPNVIFVENRREHGPRIVEHILAKKAAGM